MNRRWSARYNALMSFTLLLLVLRHLHEMTKKLIFIETQSLHKTNQNNERDTSQGHVMMCPSALTNAGAGSSSSSLVWNKLKPQIMNASIGYYPAKMPIERLPAYETWLEHLFSFYTVSRLRRSVANPGPPKGIVRLVELAAEIKRHNNGVSDETDKRTIRILVVGGSVTAGHGCTWPDFLKIRQSKGNFPHKDCAWPGRLEHLLNEVIFEGERIVRVDNMSSGGQTSEWGALVLEYRLFPEPEKVPDVVISAFAANEAQEDNNNERVLYELMQSFVNATHGLYPCDDNAPLLIMADDFYGDIIFRATQQTGYMYMISTWYNLMAVNFASVLKYKVLGEYVDADTRHPLTSSSYNIHLGSSFHIGMAWTMLFNIINAYVNVCNDAIMNINHDRNEKYVLPGIHDASLQQDDTFIGDPDLLPTLRRGEPPFKHFGPMSHGKGGAKTVAADLRRNIADNHYLCERINGTETMSKKCAYAWVVNRITGFQFKEQLAQEMDKILRFNRGWKAEGYPVRSPKTGWYTHSPNAMFSLTIPNITVDTKYAVLLTMKSYSPAWIGSKLAVTLGVIKANETNQEKPEEGDMLTYNIEGYHTTKTSVHFPHKFLFPGSGAKVGDSLFMNARMVRGSEFKIAGLAFCSF
mmetsp:Transcript_640/g.856  ORF Transcript_640/g.856 Transcript_640/m.856 type:complete len:638 (-) Transcript_640:172-2085(-)